MIGKAKIDCKCLIKYKTNYNHWQCQMRFRICMSSRLRDKGLEPTRGLELTTKPNVEEVDIER